MADLVRIMDELAERRVAWMLARRREQEAAAHPKDRQEDRVRPVPSAAE